MGQFWEAPNVIHAREENPPPDTEAVEWFLLTTIELGSPEDAEQCLRWRIKDWHRVLKPGCRIEDIADETAERARRAIAVNLVIARRIVRMTLLGRATPGLPAEVLFSGVELRTLRAFAKKELKPAVLLGEAVRLAATIGGYLGQLRRIADHVVRVRTEAGMTLRRHLRVQCRAN